MTSNTLQKNSLRKLRNFSNRLNQQEPFSDFCSHIEKVVQ